MRWFILQLPLWALLILLVLLALAVLLIRSLLPHLDQARPDLEAWLSQQLPFQYQSEAIQASLYRLDPRLGIEGISLSRKDQVFMELEYLEVELDSWSSLLAWAPRMKEVQLSNLHIWLEETPEGWKLPGWQTAESEQATATRVAAGVQAEELLEWLELLLVQGELDFSELTLHLKPLDAEPLELYAPHLNYRRWSEGRQLDFQLGLEGREARSRLLVTLEGETFNLQESSLRAWLAFNQVNAEDLHFVWPADWKTWLGVPEGELSLQAWMQLEEGQTQLDLFSEGGQFLLGDETLSFNKLAMSLAGRETVWQAALQLDALQWAGQAVDDLQAQLKFDQGRWQFLVDHFALEPAAGIAKQVFSESERLQGLLTALQPKGDVKQLSLTWAPQESWKLSGYLENLDAGAWAAAPSVKQLDAWLEMSATEGRVVFADQAFELGFPYFYRDPFALAWGQGQVSWLLDEDSIWVEGQQLAAELPLPEASHEEAPTRVTGEFSLQLLEGDQRFYLNLGLQPAQVAAHSQLVPEYLLPGPVYLWLQTALQAGKVEQGGFIYSGSLQPDRPSGFQLHLDVDAASLAFDNQWPELEDLAGWVRVDNEGVRGEVDQGRFLNAQLLPSRFTTQATPQGQALKVDSQFTAGLDAFTDLIGRSPLQEWLPEALQAWHYQGRAQGQLELFIPFYEATEGLQVRLDLDIDEAELGISQADLLFKQLKGDLQFDLAEGLSASSLQGQLWDEDFTAKISGGTNLLEFSGQQAMSSVLTWLDWPAWPWAEGKVKLDGRLPLNPLGELQLESDLQGLALDLPAPFHKTAEQRRKLSLNLGLDAADLPLEVTLEDRLQVLAELSRPELGIGVALASEQVNAYLPEASGVHVQLDLEAADLDAYWQWFQEYRPDPPQVRGSAASERPAVTLGRVLPSGLRGLDLKVQQSYWQDNQLGPLSLELAHQPEVSLDAQLSHPYLVGGLSWQQGLPLQLDLLRLRLAKTSQDQQQTTAEVDEPRVPGSRRLERMAVRREDPWSQVSLVSWPEIHWTLASLERGEQHLGRWQGRLLLEPEKASLADVEARLGESRLEGNLVWLLAPEMSSELEFKLAGGNIAPALAATLAGRSPLISNQHQLEARIQWPGSPAAWDLPRLEGELAMNFTNGYFPDTEGPALGASRFFGLMNLDNLVRRLRLDFTDVTADGVSFDRLQAEYQLEEGYLRTLEPTQMQSSATRVSLTGKIDLLEETLDQRLRVTLPVGQTLPLAALVLGAPQVGVAIWAGQKVLALFFDTRREAVYDVQGPLLDPEVKLRHLR
ncbi:YhdP family protein [Marinospirillum celere]|uniref:YhdP family phospholipid transporter n=1 Tax=Marinospirillum celere TaxID=1122252 RepID=UPI0015A725BC|nr:AsmA-like C-terminal region-containing protein [Marinospirillum celere]